MDFLLYLFVFERKNLGKEERERERKEGEMERDGEQWIIEWARL